MSVPRLLMVADYFAPSADTSAQRSSRLARHLAERGAPPVVVTVAPEFYDDASVHEVPYRPRYGVLRRLGGPGRQARMLLLQRAYRRAVRRALEAGPRPDFLYWWGHPFWYFPLAPEFHRRTGIPYVLDFVDLWYMGGVRYRLGQRSGPRRVVDRLAEARAVRGAELVLLTADPQTELYRRRYPEKPTDSFMTVRWGYDRDELAGLSPAEKPPGVFRIVVPGRFSGYSAEAASALARAVAAEGEGRRIEVLHVGEPEPPLRAAFERAGAGGALRSLGTVPYRRCLELIASADCGVAAALSDVSVPAKVYDYIGLNTPILAFAPADSALGRLLRPFPGAFVVGTREEAAAAVGRLLEGAAGSLHGGGDTGEYSQQWQFGRLVERLARLKQPRQRES
ncbi:MAG: glycosyltransferase [Planctomycetota bacterium]|jgi:hypothetical protein